VINYNRCQVTVNNTVRDVLKCFKSLLTGRVWNTVSEKSTLIFGRTEFPYNSVPVSRVPKLVESIHSLGRFDSTTVWDRNTDIGP